MQRRRTAPGRERPRAWEQALPRVRGAEVLPPKPAGQVLGELRRGGVPVRRVLGQGFEAHTIAWQTTTVFFAVLDLVAAVGLWLAAPWGAVLWLASVVSMAAVEVFFPQVYGGSIVVVLLETTLLGAYLFLAIVSARERAV